MIIDGSSPASIAHCADVIAAGGLVGLPTETVYGLAADACNDAAVAQIFAAKGRPSEHPLIVHVANAQTASHFASSIPDFAQKLMDAFWPGPLTLILPRRPEVAATAAGGQNSVGLRCPAHPVALALLTACAERGIHGLAAPSANQFGRVSPTTAAHVQGEFAGTPYSDMPILDGGACSVGIESTIIDCSRGAPVLLRPGVLTQVQIEFVCGQNLLSKEELLSQEIRRLYANFEGESVDDIAPTPRASGTLDSHYAPKAKVRLMDAKALQAALDILGTDAKHIAVYSREQVHSASTSMIFRRMPLEATMAAQQLFATLRELDQPDINLIWVETPPETADWDGVRDRLQRAAA
ncbi:MAG: L-threonylcarbamoyladenylate synthase [Burkholderiaceae bacterium]|nr:L-threonylcarbamoyladenylate synthase [Burkholderiaceae bacterium]